MGKVVPFKRPVVLLRQTVPEDLTTQLDIAIEKYERLISWHKDDYNKASEAERPAIAAAIRSLEFTLEQAQQLKKDKSK